MVLQKSYRLGSGDGISIRPFFVSLRPYPAHRHREVSRLDSWNTLGEIRTPDELKLYQLSYE